MPKAKVLRYIKKSFQIISVTYPADVTCSKSVVRIICEICSRLTAKTSKLLHWLLYCQHWSNFKHFSAGSIVDFQQENAGVAVIQDYNKSNVTATGKRFL